MKDRKHTSRLAARFGAGLDLDLGSDFYIEMRGRNSLSVSGCRGISEYSATVIGLVLYPCGIRIIGSGLLCDSYTNGAVLVSGCIDSVEFVSETNKI